MLRAPKGWATRPTSDRLRETLFNVLGARLEGTRFLDLYAGSGAMGLEALSRGAREAVFVERDRAALQAIRENVAALALQARARVEPVAVARWLRGSVGVFEVVFLDPPYEEQGEYAATLEVLGGTRPDLLAPGAVVVAEHRRKFALAPGYGRLRATRLLEQGDAALRFFATDV